MFAEKNTLQPVAIITGAGRGIGASIARQLASRQYYLVLVDICHDDPEIGYPLASSDDLRRVLEELDNKQAVAVPVDVRDPKALDEAVQMARERFGGLDIAIAAAGAIAGGQSVWQTSDNTWQTMIDVNLTGVFNLAKAAIPEILRRPVPRQGRFIAISSTAGLVGMPRIAAYAAAKHGVIGLIKAMATELGGEGVTVNAVCPGSTRGPMLEHSAKIYDLSDSDEFASQHLTGRLLDSDEIASAVVFLASPAASGITGTCLVVDAGFTTR
ncbi:MAG: mycofactocin-coupled SDR family oxidoreductase [Actinobacteria bacterium]|nr:mycofactocin-coupled SDR family oxidoreductase [Actinomycetota bacterium]MCL6095960.1 mycofactocin-coupled SDR family oxidoreductase [Actinomycetota bacterium]